MIHIATVHFKTDMWVDLQLRRLAAHLDRPYRVHAYLEGDAAAHADRFDEPLLAEKIPHWQKLDDLAARICAQADPDDVLLFLDGDAFPVAALGERSTGCSRRIRWPRSGARRTAATCSRIRRSAPRPRGSGGRAKPHGWGDIGCRIPAASW